MSESNLSNTAVRILTAVKLVGIIVIAVLLEKYGIPVMHIAPFHAIRWLGVLITACCIYEVLRCVQKASDEVTQKNMLSIVAFVAWLVLMMISVYAVGAKPWIMLWLLMIIVGADVGGWLFGKIFGGDKMWERISANKTWAGQIGGIVCGTAMSLLYCQMFHTNVAVAIWLGISIALLSQYGDLTASFIKRRLEIKDFGDFLPGHGGILDRVDGWIYVLPLIWLLVK